MTQAQLNQELENTKEIMKNLLNCVKSGKTEFYNDYLQLSTYFLKLNQAKPNHNLKLA